MRWSETLTFYIWHVFLELVYFGCLGIGFTFDVPCSTMSTFSLDQTVLSELARHNYVMAVIVDFFLPNFCNVDFATRDLFGADYLSIDCAG